MKFGIFVSGLLNGFLGSGGGSLMMPLLYRIYDDPKDAHRWVSLLILPLTVLAFITQNFSLDGFARPLALGALFGGAAGALLLDKIRPQRLRLMFALLLVFTGVRCFFS